MANGSRTDVKPESSNLQFYFAFKPNADNIQGDVQKEGECCKMLRYTQVEEQFLQIIILKMYYFEENLLVWVIRHNDC